MDPDDDDLDDEDVAPLLPPDDRIWRHPSEVAQAGATTATAAPAGRRRAPSLVTVAVLAGACSALFTLGLLAAVVPLRTERVVERVTTSSLATAPGLRDASAVAERLQPAIVQVEGGNGHRASGVMIRSDGMVLTAHHHVAGATAVRVLLADGRELSARVVGSDPETDVAVLDLEGENFPVAPLGSTDALRVGQPAITVGGPDSGAGGPVVTVGVVSAMGREVDADGVTLLDMIQTDSPVAPGCAGGAVATPDGSVIAIATRNVATDAGVLGYAVPIDVARLVAEQLIEFGRPNRPWLGIDGADLTAHRASELQVAGGTVVRSVRDASPASVGGLRPTDVIVSLDGQPVAGMAGLLTSLRRRLPGETVVLGVLRNGAVTEISVVLGERPEG